VHQKLAVHVRSSTARPDDDDDDIFYMYVCMVCDDDVLKIGEDYFRSCMARSPCLCAPARISYDDSVAQSVTFEITSEATIMASKAMVPTMSNVFSYGSLVHAIAGAVGGATAITVRVSATLNPQSLFFNSSCTQNDDWKCSSHLGCWIEYCSNARCWAWRLVVFAAFLPTEFNPAKDAGEWRAHHQHHDTCNNLSCTLLLTVPIGVSFKETRPTIPIQRRYASVNLRSVG
jgi:hypothetical protein